MSKFRYYITDLYDGDIKGTNDAEVAEGHAQSEDFFVVDTETGHFLLPGGEFHDIEEVK